MDLLLWRWSTAAQQAGWFLSATSSLDAGLEWFIALGCVLAISERSQREPAVANRYLLEAQEHLRRLADRDRAGRPRVVSSRRCRHPLRRLKQGA
ncbi:MAG: hypothetical protein AB7Q16_04215 [Vicinamibacterales bacterium]